MSEMLFSFPPEGKTVSGKRYKGPSGVEVIVTRGSIGTLTDGSTPFVRSDEKDAQFEGDGHESNYLMKLGKRYGETDPINGTFLTNGTELLVIKPGNADIRCNGFNMEQHTPKVVPSAD